MATLKNDILKGCRGRLGEYVVYQCRGKTCLRRLPERVTLTPEMVEQQERVAGIAALWRGMKANGLAASWNRAAERMREDGERDWNGYNLLVRVNSPAFSGEGRIVDFERLVMSVGRLPLPKGRQIQVDAGMLTVAWKEDGNRSTVRREDAGYRVTVVAMKQERGITMKVITTSERQVKNCQAVMELPERSEGYGHLYYFFYSSDTEEFSESRHLLII